MVERKITGEVTGLTRAEVAQRTQAGQYNVQPKSKTKTVGQIIYDNVFTLFNAINLVLAIAVLVVGSYKNALFINIIILNTIIGIVQEIKAKRTVDKLTLMTEPQVAVLREGQETVVPVEQIVLDDILMLSPGKQIPADGSVVEGQFEVNESLLTGESDAVVKALGDGLKSGSYVVSGRGLMAVEKVGADNYANQLVAKVMRPKKPNSEISRATNFILKFIGVTIIPIGLLLFFRHSVTQLMPVKDAVISTVAALIGMIPEGLVLLTSVALAVGVMRLAKHKTLVQELYCIETLSRVDVLCLDKTGTITEGKMEVKSIEPINCDADPTKALRAMVAALDDDNPTFSAIRESLRGEVPDWQVEKIVSFSSERKYSGVTFKNKGTYVLGAPEIVLGTDYESYRTKIEGYAADGNRVLLLACSDEGFGPQDAVPHNLDCAAIILLADKIRAEARQTLKYFESQGVAVKIISGDSPITVAEVALRAGLSDGANYVDASTLDSVEATQMAALKYTVFGRVSPTQKKIIIKTLKEDGHTVGMVGDGVNDVLGLREADCSIAMAGGSDVTKQISQLVLLDSNFNNLTEVLMEGRRVTNNINRAASLFLVKTIFSFLLSLIVIVANEKYPFAPIQLTLISATTIGLPSFFLALEPNRARVTGSFLGKVLRRALPGALAIVVNICLVMLLGNALDMSFIQISTLACVLTGATGLIILYGVCKPFNPMRNFLFLVCTTLFTSCILFFAPFFSILPLFPIQWKLVAVLVPMLILIYPIMVVVERIVVRVELLLEAKGKLEIGEDFS